MIKLKVVSFGTIKSILAIFHITFETMASFLKTQPATRAIPWENTAGRVNTSAGKKKAAQGRFAARNPPFRWILHKWKKPAHRFRI